MLFDDQGKVIVRVGEDLMMEARGILLESVSVDDSKLMKSFVDRAEEYASDEYESQEEAREGFNYRMWKERFDRKLKHLDPMVNVARESIYDLLFVAEKDPREALVKAVAVQKSLRSLMARNSNYATAAVAVGMFVDHLQKMEKETSKTKEDFKAEYMKVLIDAYNKEDGDRVEDLKRKIEKFCRKIDCVIDVAIVVDADNVSVDLKTGHRPEPGFTVFFNEGGGWYKVEDVLSVNDEDFFVGGEGQDLYFGLVEYLRTGKMPKAGEKVVLYRGMSSKEHMMWEKGEVIPVGKYFSSKRSAALAQDLPGEFPELYTFKVDKNLVRETDRGTYQMVREGRLERGEIVAR